MRIQPAIAVLFAFACGRGDAPAFTGSWRDAADAVELTLLSDGNSVAGTGVQHRLGLPDQPFRLYGNGASFVFMYPDGTASESFAWTEMDDQLRLQGSGRSLVFTRE